MKQPREPSDSRVSMLEPSPTTETQPSKRVARPPARSSEQPFSQSLLKFFSSLKLTVVCLVLGAVLVFIGTLAQVDLGTLKAQNQFFRSFFIYWAPNGGSWRIPVFPGGYTLGGVLLINLITAHVSRFKFTRAKAGIWIIHVGIILLLLGQLGTDMLSRESFLHLREGEAKNYTEASHEVELALVDTTEPDLDRVVAIPQRLLETQKEIRHRDLPFTVRIKQFYHNSKLQRISPESTAQPAASQALGASLSMTELPRVTDNDNRDVPGAIVEIITPEKSLGTWLVSDRLEQPQSFSLNNRNWQIELRLRRYYKPYSIQLQQFKHDVYLGTTTPKNFSSRVIVQRPDTGEKREVLIYMNSPLRYGGETYYQASFDLDDHGTVLQVVRNPSWLTPYLSCVLVALGLLVQFGMHLFSFAFKRRTA